MSPLSSLVVVLALICCGQWATAEPAAPSGSAGPLTPAEALQKFVLPADCRIELVAAEPDVIDPVGMAFGPDGKLWVVEYSDYPNGPDPSEPGRSRVRVLTDTDRDGRYENAQLFADKLRFANGLLPWRDGVLVTTDGRVLFLRDTDGDGRADEEQVWFEGFARENPQLRCSYPTLGPDNKIYIANGLRGGKIVPGATNPWGLDPSMEPLSISGMDFRFDPLTGKCEAISGVGQFGLTFDDWGNRFVCDNRHPCKQVVLENSDLKWVPWLRTEQVYYDVSPAGEHSRLYPLSKAWTTSLLHANQFTAACGLLIYRGQGLGKDYYGNNFTCDPTGNLVHRDILDPRVTTFSSHVAHDGQEFLASPDEWFRPVALAHGPDGALYICDMYRKVIEHPEFMTNNMKQRPDLLDGNDRGRIWRIVAKANSAGSKPAAPTNLADLSTAELVEQLGHENAWHRDTAQRLLLTRNDPQAVAPLQKFVSTGASGDQFGTAAALSLLQTQGACSSSMIRAGLKNPVGARRALDLSVQQGSFSSQFEDKEALLLGVIAGLLEGNTPARQDPQLLSQLLLKTRWQNWAPLSDNDTPETSPRLAILQALGQFQHEPFFPASLVIHAGDDLASLTQTIFLAQSGNQYPLTAPPSLDCVRFFSEALARKNDSAEIGSYLETVFAGEASPGFTAESAALTGLMRGWRLSPAEFRKLLTQASPAVRDRLQTGLAELQGLFSAGGEDARERIADLQLLQLGDPQQVIPLLQKLVLDGDSTLTPQVIEVLSFCAAPASDKALVELLTVPSPQSRRQVIASLVTSPARIGLLLNELEAQRISPLEIDVGAQKRLENQKDRELKARAKKLLTVAAPADRAEVIAQYESCLNIAADPQRGRLVFEKNCSMCHRIGAVGVNVGPDISDYRNKPDSFLLTNILDPNRAIDNNYFSYTVFDTSGLVHTGVLGSETATAITLKQPEGKMVTIPRQDIEELKNNGISLMPANFEKILSQQEMADLIRYIQDWRTLPSP
ncbi:PVC-type heme-binding CxxCH protein [Planctomicrobium sp. SH664]|uniref:PVC-type heme-binding CxxCH protein n=1 Tax=Planctomicrobium sp. SH664 TaxID=3448125 RepID=UPI003F5B90A1